MRPTTGAGWPPIWANRAIVRAGVAQGAQAIAVGIADREGREPHGPVEPALGAIADGLAGRSLVHLEYARIETAHRLDEIRAGRAVGMPPKSGMPGRVSS